MRAECGCLIEDGMTMHGFDGPCELAPLGIRGAVEQPSPAELCAADGHAYHGDDSGPCESLPQIGRCWCGHRLHPPGGPSVLAGFTAAARWAVGEIAREARVPARLATFALVWHGGDGAASVTDLRFMVNSFGVDTSVAMFDGTRGERAGTLEG